MRRRVRGKNLLVILLRTAVGYAQEELGERVYADRNTIYRIESGAQSCSEDFLISVIEACGGVPLLRLLKGLIDRAIVMYDFDHIKFA